MDMGRAYLAFYEDRPALYATLFSTRRTAIDKDPEVDRDQALDGVVALLQLINPALDYDAACELAILIWSSLHGYAMLRSVRPHLDMAGARGLPAPPPRGLRAGLSTSSAELFV